MVPCDQSRSMLDIESSPACSIAFLIHKPIGVLSSRVDSRITSIITKKSDPMRGQTYGGDPRPTVFDLAMKAGFPSDFSLVGRLDGETSGIMLFTQNMVLDRAVRDPPEDISKEREIKVKEYELVLRGERLSPVKGLESAELAAELAEPFTFSRHGVIYSTQRAHITIQRRWQEPRFSRGQQHLGWCVQVSIEIREGKHHQIRRMARRSQLTVMSLKRIRIAGILHLSSIPNPGDCRWLRENEVEYLLSQISDRRQTQRECEGSDCGNVEIVPPSDCIEC